MKNFPTLPVGEYLGKGRTRGENELDSLRHVHVTHSRNEPALYQTKWWDYRMMHHVEATRYWARCYSDAIKRYVTMTAGEEVAGRVATFENADIFAHRDLTGAINARQAMDRIGCRYPWAMEWIVQRYSDQGWQVFPRPNQLYGEELLMDMGDAWRLELQARLQRPEAEIFRTRGYGGMRALYKPWAIEQARSKAAVGLLWMPVGTLYREGYLDKEDVLATLPAGLAARALVDFSGR